MLALALLVLIPVTSLFWLSSWLFESGFYFPEPWRCLMAVFAPFYMAVYGLRKKSLCLSGALAGLLVGFLLTLSSLCFFSALLAFFISGSKATKFRSHLKRKLEDNYKEGGQRDWKQVMCNGGVAAWLAVLYLMEVGCVELHIDFSRHYEPSWFAMAILASLACCCGDTFASEFGSVLGAGSPRLITSLRAVPRGTNGGVSVMGTIASAVGGLVVGLGYYVTLRLVADVPLHRTPPQWPLILTGALAGLMGSVIDSLIGATCQYSGYSHTEDKIVEVPGSDVKHISGVALLDNHSVNLLSSLLTAILIPPIASSVLWPLFA
ncbi:transmembrane protein 19-like isoform X2 [Babylonia areolata]|uniref:transmembrane protein 19-like isoform X2 n=1 Tax=Babylonia areolata TaxID=304850 RepID=UPI003FCFC95D